MDFNVISDGRKSFPINHGKTSDDTLLEVSGHFVHGVCEVVHPM